MRERVGGCVAVALPRGRRSRLVRAPTGSCRDRVLSRHIGAGGIPERWAELCGRRGVDEDSRRPEKMMPHPIVHHPFEFALGPVNITGFGLAMMAAFGVA